MRLFRSLLAALLALAPAARAQDLSARLDSAMRAAERGGFSGVVRVERDGATLLERGYGLANRAEGVAFTPATIVQIGSNTKDFTAVLVLQLQQQGRLSIEDSIGKFFPGAPADKRGITLRQLLKHRAGFPQVIGGDFDALGRQALVDSAMRTRLLFAPGTSQSYSNTGYSLLAAVIEQTTGTSYDEAVCDGILAPLGLRRTGFLLPRFGAGDLAHGYLAGGTDNGTMLAKPHAADGPYWDLRGNGGMLSTVADMHAFYQALFETDRLLAPATRALMFDPTQPIGLAGSDGTNVFLYERLPMLRTELLLASTNAAMKAPTVRRELGRLLGIPDAGNGPEPLARRAGGAPAPAPIADLLTSFVRTIDAGDSTALRRFITEHFDSGPDAPPLADRVQRMRTLHERLGALTIERIESFPDGPVEVALKSAIEGPAVLLATVERVAPYRIRGIRIRVGG